MADATTVQPVPPKKPNSVQPQGVDILSNVLDSYENPTYHFRLYMKAPGAKFNDVRQRVVIAESGVSPIDIDDIEIRSTGGITKEAGTGLSTNFNFILREPFGVTLLDQIQRAGLFLGVKNFQKYPMYLELSFKGRRSSQLDAADPSNPADSPLNGLVWTWPIKITDVAMNVTSGGSSYAIMAVAYSEMAYTNQASDVEEPIVINTDTVGDFFTQLQQQLSAREESKKGTSAYEFPDTYQFYIDQEILDAKIVPDNLEERQNRMASYEAAETGKMQFTFQPGISIDKIIQNVLSLTKFFQTKALGVTDPDVAGQDNKSTEALYQTLWRVVADTEIGEYDNGRNDYQKKFKYVIIPYDMSTLQTPSKINNSQSDQSMVDSHRKRGILRKVYNYIYTGQNDQVFDFDLSFNFNWHIALPLQGGRSTQINKAEAAAKITPEQQEQNEQLIESYIKKFGGLRNNFPAGPLGGFDPFAQLIEQLKGSVDVGSLSNPFAEGMEVAENLQQDVSDVTTQVNDEVGSATGMIQDGISQANEAIPGVVTPQFSPAINGAQTILDSLRVSGLRVPRLDDLPNSPISARENIRSIDFQLDDLNTEEANQKIAVTIEEMKSGDESMDGQKYASNPGQTLLSAMFEQAGSPTGRDLINIDLNIKGDPYWIEPTPHRFGTEPVTHFRRLLEERGLNPDSDAGIQAFGEIETSFAGTSGQDEVVIADTTSRQTLIVFRSYTPQEFDPETGLTPAGRKSTNVINGVYGIRMVTHSFSAGEFKQTLHGNRDPQISLKNVNLDQNITGNIGGEYLPTVSEVFGINDSGLALTPGDGTLIDANYEALQAGDVNEFFNLGDTGLGATAFNINNIDESVIGGIGNFDIGNTQNFVSGETPPEGTEGTE